MVTLVFFWEAEIAGELVCSHQSGRKKYTLKIDSNKVSLCKN